MKAPKHPTQEKRAGQQGPQEHKIGNRHASAQCNTPKFKKKQKRGATL